MDTLQAQFSGYGANNQTVARCLDKLGLKEPLENWSDETVEKVVNAFTDEKFPTVIALNKIDHPDSDKVTTHPVKSLHTSGLIRDSHRTSAKSPKCKIQIQ